MSSAVRAGWSSGVARTWSSAASICACVTESKSVTWSRGFISNVGAVIASTGGRSSPTPGSLTMRPSKPSIWASPSGVSTSPRKTSVTTTTLESPKRVSISSNALATPLSRGRKASFSATGARFASPAANTSVTIAMTTSVTHGRTVTSQLSQLSALLIAHHPHYAHGEWQAMPERDWLWLLPELGSRSLHGAAQSQVLVRPPTRSSPQHYQHGSSQRVHDRDRCHHAELLERRQWREPQHAKPSRSAPSSARYLLLNVGACRAPSEYLLALDGGLPCIGSQINVTVRWAYFDGRQNHL